MVVFLADRSNLQSRRLHTRIKNRLQSSFEAVRVQRTNPRDPGPYRVIGEVNPRAFLDDGSYPTTTARLEVGFQLRPNAAHEHYWINWIEPERELLVGWHQDGTHTDLGPVHIQVTHDSITLDHQPARFIDAHPLAVLSQRIEAMPIAVSAVIWNVGHPKGFDQSAGVIANQNATSE